MALRTMHIRGLCDLFYLLARLDENPLVPWSTINFPVGRADVQESAVLALTHAPDVEDKGKATIVADGSHRDFYSPTSQFLVRCSDEEHRTRLRVTEQVTHLDEPFLEFPKRNVLAEPDLGRGSLYQIDFCDTGDELDFVDDLVGFVGHAVPTRVATYVVTEVVCGHKPPNGNRFPDRQISLSRH
jgi:hypothetical protein